MVYSGQTLQFKNIWIGRDGQGFIICRDDKEYAEVIGRADTIEDALDKMWELSHD